MDVMEASIEAVEVCMDEVEVAEAVSIETSVKASMEASTTSMEASTSSMEASINSI